MEKLEFHSRRGNSAGMSGGFRCACGAVFVVVLFALLGCLDIPDEPETGIQLERVNVFLFQEGNLDSTLLKIRPTDSAVVRAGTYPRQLKNSLTCQWIYLKGDSSTVLGTGFSYTIPANSSSRDIPNAVELTDEIGNTFREEFKIVVNLKPVLENTTLPADGDTLYGNKNTSIKFKWRSYDSDSFDENKLEHTLVIDNVPYTVGHLTELMQSGFSEGDHTFYVIVSDSFGDADTLSKRTFYMVDTLGRAP